MDGRVMGRVEDDGESKRSTGKEAIEVKARISECSLLLEDTSAHHRALRFKVVHWLETDLEPAIEAARDDLKALAAVTKQSSELEGHIQEAEALSPAPRYSCSKAIWLACPLLKSTCWRSIKSPTP